MNIVEFEAKTLLRNAGLPVPPGRVLYSGDDTLPPGDSVLKAQVAEGGRGKRGLVVPVDAGAPGAAATLRQLRERMVTLGHAEPVVLAEQAVSIRQECYAAWSLDDVAQDYVFRFSPRGGVDVESQAGEMRSLHFAPSQVPVAHQFVDLFVQAGLQGRTVGAMCRFACTAWRVFVHNDAQLLEINPLAILPDGDVMALDAKLDLDDNAQPRHADWAGMYSATLADRASTGLERRAAADGFTFVELEGEVAMLAGGAGIGMAILDILADAGMPAANFADASGGSGTDVFEALGSITFERAARDDVRAILMYFTLAATSVASVVRGIERLLDAVPPPKPLVIGLLCCGAAEREMTFIQARERFAARGLRCEPGLTEALEALAQARATGRTRPIP